MFRGHLPPARWLHRAPAEEIGYWVAGINHMSWFLDFTHNGRDAYPRLREAMDDPETFAKDRVRFEIMRHFGYFVTESTHHMSEYCPYFRRTPELIGHYQLARREVPIVMPAGRQEWLKDMGVKAAGDKEIALVRSHEYASSIIHAVTTRQPFRFNGNVLNHGLIDNLTHRCCVEIPCMADAEGIHPCHVGPLPPQCAALNQSNIAVQELTVQAVLQRDREAARRALLLDPLTAGTLSLPEARRMFDEMWEAEKDLLLYYE